MPGKSLFLFVVLVILTSQTALAERAKNFGNYTVHYNAVATDFLKPATAQQYKIKRSKNRGMVTIAIQEKAAPGKAMGKPAMATVSGYAKNLNGQTRNLKFRKITEGNAIYYIDDFSVTNQEVVDFVLSIKPNGQQKSYGLKFRQQFYTQ
jgi:hypothetical protein